MHTTPHRRQLLSDADFSKSTGKSLRKSKGQLMYDQVKEARRHLLDNSNSQSEEEEVENCETSDANEVQVPQVPAPKPRKTKILSESHIGKLLQWEKQILKHRLSDVWKHLQKSKHIWKLPKIGSNLRLLEKQGNYNFDNVRKRMLTIAESDGRVEFKKFCSNLGVREDWDHVAESREPSEDEIESADDNEPSDDIESDQVNPRAEEDLSRKRLRSARNSFVDHSQSVGKRMRIDEDSFADNSQVCLDTDEDEEERSSDEEGYDIDVDGCSGVYTDAEGIEDEDDSCEEDNFLEKGDEWILQEIDRRSKMVLKPRHDLYPCQLQNLKNLVMLEQKIVSDEPIDPAFPGLRGGIMADKVGFGKTLSCLALMRMFRGIVPEENLGKRSSEGLFLSNANLLIVPPHLAKQWASESHKHFRRIMTEDGDRSAFKIVTLLNTMTHKKHTYRDLCDADLVIATNNFVWGKHNKCISTPASTINLPINYFQMIVAGWKEAELSQACATFEPASPYLGKLINEYVGGNEFIGHWVQFNEVTQWNHWYRPIPSVHGLDLQETNLHVQCVLKWKSSCGLSGGYLKDMNHIPGSQNADRFIIIYGMHKCNFRAYYAEGRKAGTTLRVTKTLSYSDKYEKDWMDAIKELTGQTCGSDGGALCPFYLPRSGVPQYTRRNINQLILPAPNRTLDEICPRLEHIKWHRVFIDEVHEYMRNNERLCYLNALKSFVRWPISATPEESIHNFCNIVQWLGGDLTTEKESKESCKLVYKNGFTVASVMGKWVFKSNDADSCNNDMPESKETVQYVPLHPIERLCHDWERQFKDDNMASNVCTSIFSAYKHVKISAGVALTFDNFMKYLLKNNDNKIDMAEREVTNKLRRFRHAYGDEEKKRETDLKTARRKLDTLRKRKRWLTKAKIEKAKREAAVWMQKVPFSLRQAIINKGSKPVQMLKHIKEILDQDRDHRILVFSQFNRVLMDTSVDLLKMGVRAVELKGAATTRSRIMGSFQDTYTEDGRFIPASENHKVLLLSTKFSASGSDLHRATHIILADPFGGSETEAYAAEKQAIGRAIRNGSKGKKPVMIIRFITKDTVEAERYVRNKAKERKSGSKTKTVSV